MPKKKLKDVTCLDICCADCPLQTKGCQKISIDEKFGDFFKRNPKEIPEVDLENEVEVDE